MSSVKNSPRVQKIKKSLKTIFLNQDTAFVIFRNFISSNEVCNENRFLQSTSSTIEANEKKFCKVLPEKVVGSKEMQKTI